MRFEFATAGRIMFGPGTLRDFQAAEFGKKALVVAGPSEARLRPLKEVLDRAGEAMTHFVSSGEPTIGLVSNGVLEAQKSGSDFVIGFGGGSAIDAAKAIAAMLTNPGDILEYLEVIGNGKPLVNPPLPYVAIPTTAGTGAEATRNAVLASPAHRVKVSLRSPLMLPRLALVDPELTRDLPPGLTASTGMDALTQLIEAYVCTRANPMTDALCREGLTRASQSLRRAYVDPEDMTARTDMALGSLFSGIALANAGLGAVHGFAAAIGGMYHAPDGAICAALLPHVMEANVRVLRDQQPRSEKLVRYHDIAQWLTGDETAEVEDGIQWVRKTSHALQIAGLRNYGIKPEEIPDICERAQAASSMKANPIAPLTDPDW